jgi:hypothetical protein
VIEGSPTAVFLNARMEFIDVFDGKASALRFDEPSDAAVTAYAAELRGRRTAPIPGIFSMWNSGYRETL